MAHLGTVGTATASASESAVTITLTDGVPAGATVLIGCVWESAAASIPVVDSVVDSGGNTYVEAGDASAGGPLNSTVAATIIRGEVSTPLEASDTITVTITGGTRSRWCLQADAFDDVVDTDPLDQIATTGNASPSSATPSTGTTPETTEPHELLYAVFGFGGNRTVDEIPAGWTGGAKLETAAGSGNRAMQVIHRYVAAVDEYEATITLSSSSTYAACMATYEIVPPETEDPVAHVSQLALEVPNPGTAATAQVSQLALEVPAAVQGRVQVSQLSLTVPAASGQAPYTGVKAKVDGLLWDAQVWVAGPGS